MSDAQIKAVNLSYSFEESGQSVPVINNLSMQANSQKVTSIVGPSGCGKSSLLYLLGLLDQPDQGDVVIGNRSMVGADEFEKNRIRNEEIGFVFQFHFLIKELTVLENVRLPLFKAGIKKNEANHRSSAILEKLGLMDKISRPAYKLSGGEQQRVAIARALVNSPKILLADEPTGNLDSRNSEIVFEILQNFSKEQNLCVLMVTHNSGLAERSDEVIEMKDGKIIS